MEYDENGQRPATKVYVACSSRELDRAERVMAAIRERGGIVTFDWTVDVRRDGPRPSCVNTSLRCARNDLDGVKAADVVLVLDDGEYSYGRTIEHGAALALGKRVVVSGPPAGRIWETLEHGRYGSDTAAIDAVFSFAGS